MLNESGSQIDEEFLEYFVIESLEVLVNLKEFMRNYTDESLHGNFEQFGQQVDRIMGAAYTLSLKFVGDLARTGKELGYKSSQISEINKLLAVQSLLSQLTKALDLIVKNYSKGIQPNFKELEPLLKRLQKASKDMGNLRTTVKL